MEYNTQNYWVSGLRPSSGILNTRKYIVSETGSVIDPVIEVSSFSGTQHTVFPLHLRMETDPVFETLCFLVLEYPTKDKVKRQLF
jgi:hypothetical protein